MIACLHTAQLGEWGIFTSAAIVTPQTANETWLPSFFLSDIELT